MAVVVRSLRRHRRRPCQAVGGRVKVLTSAAAACRERRHRARCRRSCPHLRCPRRRFLSTSRCRPPSATLCHEMCMAR